MFKADRFDPGLNRTYAETAGHYGTAILPARPYKPRDKAKVEVAVQVAQRWIVVLQARLWRDARLRNLRFFSLADLNAAIRRLLDELNMRIMRGYGASRADLFATIDRPNLEPLPPEPYAFARWKRARVAPDYHVEVDSSWYSVPFGLIRQEVDTRICGGVVEIFHKGQRVASHPRCPGSHRRCAFRATQPRDAARAHALVPPSPCGVDAGSGIGAGREARPICGGVLRGGDGRPTPSRAGLPHLSRCPRPGQDLRAHAPRCRLSAWAHHPRPLRCLDQIDPEDRPRQRLPRRRARPASASAPEYPPRGTRASGATTRLLPLKGDTILLIHPTSERLIALGFTGMATALDEQRQASATFDNLGFEDRLGLLVDREAGERDAKRLITPLKFAALRQAACVEDLDLRAPRGIDGAVMAHLVDGAWIGRHENLLIHCPAGDLRGKSAERGRTRRPRKELDRLCSLPQGLPGRPTRRLSPGAEAVRGARHRPRRRAACQDVERP